MAHHSIHGSYGVMYKILYVYIYIHYATPLGPAFPGEGGVYIYIQIMYSMLLTNKPWFNYNYNCKIGDRLRS